MKRVLVPLAPGFEELEAVAVIDILRRAGLEVTVAGTVAGPIEGSRGIRMIADGLLDQVSPADFDLIAIPGGGKGVENLKQHPRMLPLLGEFNARGKWIGAICAAPTLLTSAGLACGKQMTSHPTVKSQVASAALYTEDRVAVDGKVVTSRGPGTAVEFALKLVELLVGPEKVSELKQALVAP